MSLKNIYVQKHTLLFILLLTAVFGGNIQNTLAQQFQVSAYYSPQPGQDRYVSGSYAADLRMNGNGSHGADGTPVYVGMISAPSKYAFGTKISLPGFGVGTVHDRGGAIYSSKGYDRLDVWMGKGDEGRKRALQWGRKIVEGEIVSSNTSETLPLSSGEITRKKYTKTSLPASPLFFTHNRELGNSGSEVKKIQKFLHAQNLFSEEISGTFDAKTEESVFLFQQKYNIVSNRNSWGAGVWGPKTRKQANIISLKKPEEKKTIVIPAQKTKQNTPTTEAKNTYIFTHSLSRGDSGEEVEKMQTFLQKNGFLSNRVVPYFGPQTENAVFAFQKQHNIVPSRNSWGAGVWGPKTRKQANKKY